MANLIVCCDGTWNTPDQEDNGLPSPTNVVKIHSAVAKLDANGIEQKKFYRPGVGTSGGWLTRLRGGGLGVGLSHDIKSAYKWLSDTYEQGDDIYMFGFSRGAYAVRSLAGLLGRCSLLRFDKKPLEEAEKWCRVDAAYSAYRALKPGQPWVSHFPKHTEVKVKFLGVWDTVGALGIPDELFINIIDRPRKFQFHDTELGSIVATARHALAIDERRQTFTPTLWTKFHPNCDVEQKWFAGVHGDVGGSYFADGLGDITLEWMMRQAEAKDLVFRNGAFTQLKPNHMSVMHNSVKGIFARLRSLPRSVPNLKVGNNNVDSSARKRQNDPPLSQSGYWKTKTLAQGQCHMLDVYARERWNATGLFLEKSVKYNFKATGEWLDASIHCSPDGPVPGFQAGKIAYAVTAFSDWLQHHRRRKPGNASAVARGARREETMPWFCLVGVIANSSGVDPDTHKLSPHETFKIGSSCTYTPKESGYLYCFANDLWSFYGNNKGSVRLTVKRL
ncbi:DUF2235 domain-containing protein [Leisingera sp. M658]|uniref:DUF2235 domain-containing protein n=1 Tax=Leisingera sp. M658 TaxID=2867015 RepID=UPI0021A659BA|nr:DUF2235 domain-containing protein [Leisingera sp. M658]UWQ74408.1 DUF2235 domain-containing protein [Leisingera sp. M658]